MKDLPITITWLLWRLWASPQDWPYGWVLGASGAMRPAFLDPVFYWRGAMALLMFAVAILLVQIRNK